MSTETKKCIYCAEEINEKAIKCKHCGEFLKDGNPSQITYVHDTKESDHVRKGITNAGFNEENSGILFGELAIIAIVCGVYWQSWWVFGGVFLGLMIILAIKPLAILLCILLSIGWAIIGYAIGIFFDSNSASIVLGIIGLLIGIGVHFSALQWANDLGD